MNRNLGDWNVVLLKCDFSVGNECSMLYTDDIYAMYFVNMQLKNNNKIQFIANSIVFMETYSMI